MNYFSQLAFLYLSQDSVVVVVVIAAADLSSCNPFHLSQRGMQTGNHIYIYAAGLYGKEGEQNTEQACRVHFSLYIQ